MHPEILTPEQLILLPALKKFARSFYLVGGTAIALYLGHRRSIDFDLFSAEPFNNLSLQRKLFKLIKIDQILVNKKGELTLLANGVKLTFFEYPFKIEHAQHFQKIVELPDLLTLAAMKIYALGMRAKWKDYVDLYFIIKDHYSLEEVIRHAKSIFKEELNQKICRAQLSYFKDINYSEKIDYLPSFKVGDAKIKAALTEFSLQI